MLLSENEVIEFMEDYLSKNMYISLKKDLYSDCHIIDVHVKGLSCSVRQYVSTTLLEAMKSRYTASTSVVPDGYAPF